MDSLHGQVHGDSCVCVVSGARNMNVNIPGVDKERLLAHLDHNNPNTFEVEDLSRLIKQVSVTISIYDCSITCVVTCIMMII